MPTLYKHTPVAHLEETAHPTAYHHLNQLSVNIRLSGLVKFRKDSGVRMQQTRVTFRSLHSKKEIYLCNTKEIYLCSTSTLIVLSHNARGVCLLINGTEFSIIKVTSRGPEASQSPQNDSCYKMCYLFHILRGQGGV